ncbi:MAG TPA: hypothetical protein DF294_10795 [Psychrobacter sp.]|nr:hypothetical protein [Psychrobacter sp.]
MENKTSVIDRIQMSSLPFRLFDAVLLNSLTLLKAVLAFVFFATLTFGKSIEWSVIIIQIYYFIMH